MGLHFYRISPLSKEAARPVSEFRLSKTTSRLFKADTGAIAAISKIVPIAETADFAALELMMIGASLLVVSVAYRSVLVNFSSCRGAASCESSYFSQLYSISASSG